MQRDGVLYQGCIVTDRYAVIGRPIAHSKSPDIHLAFAQATGQDLAYGTIEGMAGRFAADVDAFRAQGGRGLNVTAPFKLDAVGYATELQEDARLAGAVNCLSFDGDRVVGLNFDGVGLVRDLKHNLGVELKGRRILMLGAGGAARGALRPFLAASPAELVLVNRTLAKAEDLLGPFAEAAVQATTYDGIAGTFDVVINATSASLTGELLPVPPAVFAPGCLAYDLAYGKGLTPFLRLAEQAGAGRLADGVGMLVEQAAEAFALWRGVRPETAPTIAAMTIPLT